MLQQNQFKFDFDDESEEQIDSTIIIGYYNLRGKAQVPRLLCEYLHIDYKDELYSLSEWDRYKRTQAKQWEFPDLPYVKEGNFVVTEPTPICTYLIKRFGSEQLLGKTLQDKSIVSMYVWTIETMGNIVNINCQKKTAEELQQLKKNQWNNNVSPRLEKYEEIAKENDWFLGYFTLIDLSMYELVRYMELIFPGQLKGKFPKIKAIEERVAMLPEIKNYEVSERAIRQTDPTTLLEELKRSKMANTLNNSSSSNNTNNNGNSNNSNINTNSLPNNNFNSNINSSGSNATVGNAPMGINSTLSSTNNSSSQHQSQQQPSPQQSLNISNINTAGNAASLNQNYSIADQNNSNANGGLSPNANNNNQHVGGGQQMLMGSVSMSQGAMQSQNPFTTKEHNSDTHIGMKANKSNDNSSSDQSQDNKKDSRQLSG